MGNVVKIVLLILLPLAWGLGVEFIFERIRRRRSCGKSRPYDRSNEPHGPVLRPPAGAQGRKQAKS